MARPEGDDSSKPPTAISRPDGGWFARIWTQRSPGGNAGSGPTSAGDSDANLMRLGRSVPFTIWTHPDAVPAKASGDSKSGIESASFAPAAGAGAFTLWTGSDAGAATPPPVVASAETEEAVPISADRPANSRAFTLWTSAGAASVAAGVVAIPNSLGGDDIDHSQEDEGFDADSADPETGAPPAGVSEIAESPISLEHSGAFTLWSGGGDVSSADVASITAAPDEEQASSTTVDATASAAAISPIPVSDSNAFTLWAGGASDPGSTPISTASMTNPVTSSENSNGGSKAFTLWAPAAAGGVTAAAVAASSSADAAPDRDEPKWERAVDQPRQESANLLPLVAAALTLIGLLIALFVIAERNKEVRNLEGRVGTLTSEKEQLGKEGAKRETKLQAARTELATTSGTLTAAKDAHIAQVKEFETKVGGLEATLKGAQEKLVATEKERDGLAAAKTAAEKQIGELKTSLATAKTASEAAAKAAAEKLSKAETAAKAAAQTAAENLTKAQTAAAEAKKELAATEVRIGDLGKKITDLGKEITTLKSKIADLESTTPETPAEPKPTEPKPDAPAETPAEPEAPKKDDAPSQV